MSFVNLRCDMNVTLCNVIYNINLILGCMT